MSGPASDIDYRTNPRALKWWRLKNHYSQRDVEEQTGVSYTTISRLENGHRTRARFGTLEKLAQVYGCTVEDLIVLGSQRWRRPRHTLKGRQDAHAVDRAGLRRKLLKAQAEAGDIVLLFADESEALTHPYLAHVWAKKGADLRVPAPGQAAKVAMLGVLDWGRRKLIVRTSRTKRSSDFIALLEEVDQRYGPKLGVALTPIVLVLDNGPIHTSKASRAALAERAHWLTVEWLPKYAPELNDIEGVWRDLKRHHLAHQTLSGPDDLDRAIQDAVTKLNTERSHRSWAKQQIAASCLVAERSWDQVRWAIEEHAWRFDGSRRRLSMRSAR